jgi:hypothetical protein
MAERRVGLIMNGVTGRMGTNQHLIRSVAAIRADGGVRLRNGDRLMPDPVLVGRDRGKLERWAGRTAWSASPPTSTPAWPTRATSCSSTPPPRSSAPG